MTLHRIVDGHCQPPMTETTPAMAKYAVPEGYKYTTLPRGQGKYNYKELTDLEREEYRELTNKQIKFIYRGHPRVLKTVVTSEVTKEKEKAEKERQQTDTTYHERLRREHLQDRIYLRKLGISAY